MAKPRRFDCHCHLDRYSDPMAVVREAAREGVFVVGVTNLPSHFQIGRTYLGRHSHARLAVGLHPLTVAQHEVEHELFAEMANETAFIGEVGLDFSQVGRDTRADQLRSFRFVVSCLSGKRKFITIHSRGAESVVLDVLKEGDIGSVVFHWFTGSMVVLQRVIMEGHYFSINPAMVATQKGRRIIAEIPRDKILTESDGPYAKFRGRPCHPRDVVAVEEHLSSIWELTVDQVQDTLERNFRRIINSVR